MRDSWRTGAITLVAQSLVLVSGSLAAQMPETIYVDLAQARRLALEQSPSFLAEAQRLNAAEGALRNARTFFNPEAEAELPGTIEGVGPRPYEVVLSQTVEWAGQRGLRIDAAEAGLEGADATVREATRRTTWEVSEAFYVSLAADRRLEVAEEILGLNERLLEAVEIQVREGQISTMDSNFAEIEAARSLARVLAARREATSAALELGRLLGAPPEMVVSAREQPAPHLPAPSSLQLDALLATAANQRPDLDARTHQVRQSETLTRLARREAIPNVGVGALVTGGEEQLGTRVGLQFSLPVPLWNRNQGLIAEREADARRASLERDAVDLMIRAEVTDTYRAYLSASEEEALFAAQVLEPARRNQELLETAYREGEIDLPALVLLRNQLLDAETGYWDSWLARRSSFTELEAAIGSFDLNLENL